MPGPGRLAGAMPGGRWPSVVKGKCAREDLWRGSHNHRVRELSLHILSADFVIFSATHL